MRKGAQAAHRTSPEYTSDAAEQTSSLHSPSLAAAPSDSRRASRALMPPPTLSLPAAPVALSCFTCDGEPSDLCTSRWQSRASMPIIQPQISTEDAGFKASDRFTIEKRTRLDGREVARKLSEQCK